MRARRPNESATLFLPAVRPLLALAAELEQERNHVIAPRGVDDDGLDAIDLREVEAPDSLDFEFEALEAEAEFAHVLYAGAAHTGHAADTVDLANTSLSELTEEDEEFLGLPGLLSPQMTATLLKAREVEVRKKTLPQDGATDTSPADRPVHEQLRAVRAEINSLVAQSAARTGEEHRVVHARLRKAVPGPPSAAASLEILERRRDHLLSLG